MYENLKTFLIVITFTSYLTINTYVYYVLITKLFKNLPNQSRFAFIGISFFSSATIISIGLNLDSHIIWIILHLITYFYFIHLKRHKLFILKNFRIQDKYLFLGGIIIFAQSVFVYYNDSINHISMNFPDSFTNYRWAILNYNLEGVAYPPGLSSLIIPLMKLFNLFYNLNFIGSTLGVVSFFILILTLKTFFEIKQMMLLIIVLLSPLFNILTTVRSGFHGGSAFQVVLINYATFLILSIQNKTILNKLSLIFIFNTLIFFQAGIFSIPQLATLLILNFLLSSLIIFYRFIRLREGVIFIISSFVGSFLSIVYTNKSQIKSSTDTLYASSSAFSSAPSISYFDIVQDFLNPTFPIRPIFESRLSFTSYLVLPILLYVLYTALRIKNVTLLVIVTSTIYYLFVTQTGVFEFSFAKGRSGWNLLLLVPIVFILYFSNFITSLKTKFLFMMAAISFATSIVSPPTSYRIDSEEGLYAIKNLTLGREINLYSDFSDAKFIGNNINIISKEELRYNLESNYVLLNMSNSIPDLYEANWRRYEDRDFKSFYENQSNIVNKRLKNHYIFIEQLTRQNYKVLVIEPEFTILKGDET